MEPFIYTPLLTVTPFARAFCLQMIAFGFCFPFSSRQRLNLFGIGCGRRGRVVSLVYRFSFLMKRWLTRALLTLIYVIGSGLLFPMFWSHIWIYHSRRSWGVTLIIAPYYPWQWMASIRHDLENKAAKGNSAILYYYLYLCLFNCDTSKCIVFKCFSFSLVLNLHNGDKSSHIHDLLCQECVGRLTSDKPFSWHSRHLVLIADERVMVTVESIIEFVDMGSWIISCMYLFTFHTLQV